MQIDQGEGDVLEINCQILQVDDKKFCFEFSKKSGGNSFGFFDQFNKIKEFFGEFANASY